MNATEKSFLQQMDRVANVKEAWITTGRSPIPADMNGQSVAVSAGGVVDTIEALLKQAGRVLGLNTRWHVFVSLSPQRSVAFVPKNGQSGRMLQRYEELYMEREMSDGYGE